MQPNIVFLDEYSLGDADLGSIRALGNYTGYRTTVREEVADRCREADVVITNKVVFRRETLRQLPRLRLICVAATGMNHIDLEAAAELGIAVKNAVGYSTHAVTETTIGAAIGLLRQTVYYDRYVKTAYAGSPLQYHFGRTTHQLYGSKWGIVGLGNIGRSVARVAEALGCRIAYTSTSGVVREEPYPEKPLDELLRWADVVSVHAPLNDRTRNLIGARELALMKPSAILINVARGGIYNIDSLADFLAAGKIGAAGIDVFEDEPCTQSPLHEFPNAILTPHLGAYTYEAQRRAGVQIADYIAAGLEGSVVPTALNMAPVPPEVMDAVGPYVPACQMMGSMLAQLGGEVPKRLSLTASGKAAPADATILMAGTLQGLLSYKNLATVVTPVNAEAVARRHGIRVDTGAHASAGAYSSSVTVVADGREIGCTLSGEDQHVRLISLLGYKVDIAPGPQALIFQYEDRPGRVGTIGSILGDAGINITTMQIVNDPEAGQAIVYMNIEGELDDSVLAKLRENLEDLKNLWYVKL